MGYKTYGPKVAIVRDSADEKTEGGLYIPETHQHKTPVGTLIAIGPGVDHEDFDYGFTEGERVMFSKYGGTVFSVMMPDGTKINVEFMHAKDVFMGWEGEDPNEIPTTSTDS